jgi:multicomponent Na+:H+ antiporter subunit F
MIFNLIIFIISIALILSLYRALVGPTLFDRLLAANIIGTTTVLFLVIYGFLSGRTDFLDIAITYILLNLIGTFAVLKYFRYGTLSHGEEE